MTGFTGHLRITMALAALLLLLGVPVQPFVPTPNALCVSEYAGPYLHTCGSTIVDAHGHAVRLRAVNWYGFESNDFVVAGLDHRPLRAIIGTIKSLGYNGLRLPFSNEMVERNPVVSQLRRSCPQGAPATACRPIDGGALLAANPDLRGLTALRILKTIVDYAGAHGLYVFLDDHRSRAGWGPQENGLWYDTAHGYTQSSWLHDWQHVVPLFARDPALTGVDLFNEPHSLGPPGERAMVRQQAWLPTG